MSDAKPVVLSKPEEIESAQRNGFGDLLGWYSEPLKCWLAWQDDLREWRERQQSEKAEKQ